jgi:hypothetical protein
MEQRQGVRLYASGLEAIQPDGTYTVAANGVLAASERFTALRHAWDRSVAGTDLEALVAWFERAT